MKRQQLATVFALLLIAMPLPAGIFPSPTGNASALFPSELNNSTFDIPAPAFIYVTMYWTDGLTRKEVMDFQDVLVVVQGDGHPTRAANANPIPVEPASSIRISIYPRNVGGNGYLLWDQNYTSGAAGSYHTVYIVFNMNVLLQSHFFPVRIQFRPYDASTGAGLPVEQFNITVQYGDDGSYLANNETPIGGGFLNTYWGFPIIVRARDYFGNLLYNETRTLRMNESNFCVPENAVFDPGVIPCGLKSDSFYTWDIPMNVYSTKFYNQKPDQFVRITIHWNGTGAGEEVMGGPNSGLFPPWWNSAYSYRQRLLINMSSATFVGFDFNMSFNPAPYVVAGKMQSDYRDLRVAFYNETSGAWTELNRSLNTTSLRLYFKAQVNYTAGSQTRSYFLYYGNQIAAGAPTFTIYRDLILTTSGTLAYWPMDETSGSTFVDISGHGYNCGINGAPTLGVTGEVAKAVDWGDTNGRRCNASPIATAQFTVEGWYKGTSTPAQGRELVSDHWGSSDHNFIVRLMSSNKAQFEVRAGSSTGSITAATAFTNGLWYHVAFTYDGTNLKLYQNAALDPGTATATGTFPRITQQLVFAYEGFSDRGLPGSEDEWSFTNRALSASEIAARFQEGVGQNGSATVALDTSQGFDWYQSPGETVERWLNPGYYSVRIATDNTTGVQTVASVGINVTSANYYMISGLNITHFVGDFFQISNQQLILQSALRPDVITIGELLPRNPSELTSPGADLYLLIHPFSILTGTSAYTPPGSGANLTAFAPNMTSDSGDGALFTTMTVLKDVYVFGGSSTAHVWINATNGTTLWENASLPPGVTLTGYSGDVYVTSNQSIQVTRVSDFRAIWEFSFRYYPSTKRYEQTLTLNNTDNRTILQPKWFVGFPENRSINESTGAVKDLDNVVWLTNGQNFEVGHSGFYMDFDALNESTERRFFFTFYDRNDTLAMSTPVLELHEIVKSSFDDDSSYYKGTVTFINGFQTDYRGDIAIRFTCKECANIKADSIQVVDRNTGRTLDVKDFYPTGAGVIIVSEAVGTVEIGSSKIYDVYVKLTLTGETTGPGIFGPLVNVAGLDLSVFLILVLITIGSLVGTVMVTGKGEKEEAWRSTWLSAFFIFSMITLTLFIAHAQGWLA